MKCKTIKAPSLKEELKRRKIQKVILLKYVSSLALELPDNIIKAIDVDGIDDDLDKYMLVIAIANGEIYVKYGKNLYYCKEFDPNTYIYTRPQIPSVDHVKKISEILSSR